MDSYFEVIGKEAEIIGCSDHLLQEFPTLIEFARRKVLDLSHVITRTVPLEAGPINKALDALQRFGGEVRTVIVPQVVRTMRITRSSIARGHQAANRPA